MMFDNEVKYDYSDVMLLPQLGATDAPQSRADVNLLTPYFGEGLFEHPIKSNAVPIIAANMDSIGTFEMAASLGAYSIITALHKHYSIKKLVDFYVESPHLGKYVIYSMGANDADFKKYSDFIGEMAVRQLKSPVICIDVANGYTRQVADFIEYVKKIYNPKIIAGNVVTREGVAHLARAGADIIKVGIGPGSVCTTRKLTGIGCPQFSAVLECVDQAHNYHKDIQIIADGGITCPGDIAKALAAGADYVMVGGMFAGHDEGIPSSVIPEGYAGNPVTLAKREGHVPFYGMASRTAQDRHNGGVAEYRASEGKEVLVPYRGPVRHTVEEILGGLRSSCAYQGIKNLSDISMSPKFIRVNRQLNNVFGT